MTYSIAWLPATWLQHTVCSAAIPTWRGINDV